MNNPFRPSARWRQEHRGRAPRGDGPVPTHKISHERWCDALRHAAYVVATNAARGDYTPLNTYICKWEDAAPPRETAEPHWHVGRSRTHPHTGPVTKA